MKTANLMSSGALLSLRKRDRIYFWSRGLAGYTLLVIGVAVALAATLQPAAVVASDSLHQVEDEAAHRDRQLAASLRLLAERQQLLGAARAIGERPDWSVLLGILAWSRSDSIDFIRLEIAPVVPPTVSGGSLRPGRYQLLLGGFARDHGALTQFVVRLEELKLFEHVRLVDNRVESNNGSDSESGAGIAPRVAERTYIRFVIEAQLDDSSATAPPGGRVQGEATR